jgi:hypothetical protein
MTIEAQAQALAEHHKAIKALGTLDEVLAYADRVNNSDHPKHIAEDLLHHLERRRVELVRKSGALAG